MKLVGTNDNVDPVEQRVIDGLESCGLAVVDRFLSARELAAWRAFARGQRARLTAARVGRARVLDPSIRGDHTRWLDPAEGPVYQPSLAERMARLQQAINRNLFLGLRDFEMHIALYAAGARYAPHIDRLRDDDTRLLSCVLYLNGKWLPDLGGQLRLYAGENTASPHQDILPVGGRLVVFLADRFLHEVKPARRERWSLTGWFHRRAIR